MESWDESFSTPAGPPIACWTSRQGAKGTWTGLASPEASGVNHVVYIIIIIIIIVIVIVIVILLYCCYYYVNVYVFVFPIFRYQSECLHSSKQLQTIRKATIRFISRTS